MKDGERERTECVQPMDVVIAMNTAFLRWIEVLRSDSRALSVGDRLCERY